MVGLRLAQDDFVLDRIAFHDPSLIKIVAVSFKDLIPSAFHTSDARSRSDLPKDAVSAKILVRAQKSQNPVLA